MPGARGGNLMHRGVYGFTPLSRTGVSGATLFAGAFLRANAAERNRNALGSLQIPDYNISYTHT